VNCWLLAGALITGFGLALALALLLIAFS